MLLIGPANFRARSCDYAIQCRRNLWFSSFIFYPYYILIVFYPFFSAFFSVPWIQHRLWWCVCSTMIKLCARVHSMYRSWSKTIIFNAVAFVSELCNYPFLSIIFSRCIRARIFILLFPFLFLFFEFFFSTVAYYSLAVFVYN